MSRVMAVILVVGGCSGGRGDGGGGEIETAGSDFLDGLAPADIHGSPELHLSNLAGWSAPLLFLEGIAPLSAIGAVPATAYGEPAGPFDPDCPVLEEEAGVTTVRGSCTDADGYAWTGAATIEGSEASGGVRVAYDDFGVGSTRDCGGATLAMRYTWTGTWSAVESGRVTDFAEDLRLEGDIADPIHCDSFRITSGFEYAGTVESGEDGDGDGNPDVTTWNGTGRFGSSVSGVVETSTTDEVSGPVCESEAESGSTTVRAGADVAVFTYDGATDCDAESTVTWTLDGDPQGEVAGVRCSVGAPTAPGSVELAFFGLSAALVVRRASKRHGTY